MAGNGQACPSAVTGRRLKTLLHICCGPCATATVIHWRREGQELEGYFFNPNIQPLLEFRRRLEGVRDFAASQSLPLAVDLFYDPTAWFQRVAAAGKERCAACIGWRMEWTAAEALARDCKAFTSSLAISPWQDQEAIKETGRRAAEARGLTFLYEDLRPLYRESRELSRQAGLYRQRYCGCILSEWERYRES
jgi:predicted adenine nucleotide alpha hydrolase (AANH) superfamily ATPase